MGGSKAGGGRTLLLLVLLGLLAGVGAWNYQRNLAAEEAEPRPFRGYSDADLATLADAYGQEVEAYTQRLEAAPRARVREGGFIGDRVQEFERVQKIGREAREIRAKLSARRTALAQIEAEQRKRAEGGTGLTRVLRLAFRF